MTQFNIVITVIGDYNLEIPSYKDQKDGQFPLPKIVLSNNKQMTKA